MERGELGGPTVQLSKDSLVFGTPHFKAGKSLVFVNDRHAQRPRRVRLGLARGRLDEGHDDLILQRPRRPLRTSPANRR